VYSAAGVEVQSVVGAVNVTCPQFMATYVPSGCDIEVRRGTEVELTVSYEDGDGGAIITDTFRVSGRCLDDPGVITVVLIT